MDTKVESYYREIFRDLTLDSEESQELLEYFSTLNPPPDKIVWLGSTAFRIGSEFLSEDKDTNVKLIRTINAIIHCLEKTCMVPVGENADSDSGAAEEMIRNIYSDLSVDREESYELFEYFQSNIPPESGLVPLRASAFKAAVDYLSEDKQQNIALLKSISAVVKAFHRACYKFKEYKLKLAPSFNLDVNLSDAAQELWELDVNRLTPNVDYKINVQRSKHPGQRYDAASEPLFSYVQKAATQRPTYRAFMSLLDNYEADVGKAERVTGIERQEISTFLDVIMQTAPMQFCHKYLQEKVPGTVSSSQAEFKKLLHKIWFDLYNRGGGRNNSCGFEHVFVGEIKNGQISGFHNWIMFYLEEQKGNVDYRGYIRPRGRNNAETNDDDNILTLQFSWNGVEKFVGTSFIGVSPEYEMALYTMCFLLGEEDNEITLDTGSDEFVLNIKCYRMGRDWISTTFPEVKGHSD